MINMSAEIFCKISVFTHSSPLESIYLFRISLSTKRHTERSPPVTTIGFQKCHTILGVNPYASTHVFLFFRSLMKSKARRKSLLLLQMRMPVWGDTNFVYLWHEETVNMDFGAVNTFRR